MKNVLGNDSLSFITSEKITLAFATRACLSILVYHKFKSYFDGQIYVLFDRTAGNCCSIWLQ